MAAWGQPFPFKKKHMTSEAERWQRAINEITARIVGMETELAWIAPDKILERRTLEQKIYYAEQDLQDAKRKLDCVTGKTESCSGKVNTHDAPKECDEQDPNEAARQNLKDAWHAHKRTKKELDEALKVVREKQATLIETHLSYIEAASDPRITKADIRRLIEPKTE